MKMSPCMWWCCCCLTFVASFVSGNKVKEPRYPEPKFLPRLMNVTVREGTKAKLPCAVHFLGTRQVTWRKVGGPHFLTVGNFQWVKDINIDLETVKLTPEITEWNLVFMKVNKNESGTYKCQISASVLMTRYIQLNVLPKHRAVIGVSGEHYVDQGQPIHLFCNTTAPSNASTKRPLDLNHLRVDWFKDGRSLQLAKHRHIVVTHYYSVQHGEVVSELRIDRSKAPDTGTYICRSPTDHIASHKVTVLLADTTNVKRDNADKRPSISSPSSSAVATNLSFSLLIARVLCSVTSSHWV